LRITEIMYNPTALTGSPTDPQEYEYVELKNISPNETLNLSGVRFVEGITFDFTGSLVTSLAPGARVLVVRNTAAFTAKHGSGWPVAGQFAGALDNAGERLRLLDAANEEILDFAQTGTKDPHAELPTLDEHDPAGSYEDWRIQILGLAQVEV